MNEDVIAAVLAPVPGERPCGQDVSELAQFGLLQGKVDDYAEYLVLRERELAGEKVGRPLTERPDWDAILVQVAELSAKGKHLRIGTWALVALTARDGLSGLVAGAEILAGMIETYWPDIHPQLDPADRESVEGRLAILGELREPVSSFMRVLQRVALVSTAKGAFSWLELERAAGRLPAPAGRPSLGSEAIKALVLQADSGLVDTAIQALDAAAGHFLRAHGFLSRTLGEPQSVGAGLATLAAKLQVIVGQIRSLAGEPVIEKTGTGEPGDPMPRPPPPPEPKGLQSSRDVVRLLDQICAWYKVNEPSSPVPLLLLRARSWAGKDFRSLLLDISPGAEADLSKLFGAPEAPAEAAAEPSAAEAP